MKSQLDNSKTYDQYDSRDVYDSILNTGRQFESSWHDAQYVNLNFEPDKIKDIVFVGMGGSNLPAHVVLSLSPLLLKIPFVIVANYRIPQFTSKNTLVILTSYS